MIMIRVSRREKVPAEGAYVSIILRFGYVCESVYLRKKRETIWGFSLKYTSDNELQKLKKLDSYVIRDRFSASKQALVKCA